MNKESNIESNIIEFYRGELQRIAWRLQYKARVKSKHELPLKYNLIHSDSFTEHADNKIFIQQLIDLIPSDTGKKIIYEIYINDKTEAQVAREINISQQAVNKWNRQIIQLLHQKLRVLKPVIVS